MSRTSGGARIRQHVRFARAADGTRLAWADSGTGPLIIKAANWLTHLEYELDSPVWAHWLRFFSSNWRFVRYDERGCGMSDWHGGPTSIDHWVSDLETIVEAAHADGPFVLFGVSQGAAACVEYCVRHPGRVSRLVLYGGYATGSLRRGGAAEVTHRAMIDLARVAWGHDNPTFRQVFTSRFIPGGTPEQLQWFNDLCRTATTPEVAASLLEARGMVDVIDVLPRVTVPTLVLHARNDEVVPVSEGRRLASGIPHAQFVELDSRNHVLLEDEPAWQRFCDAVTAFLQPDDAAEVASLAALSERERQVLALITEGLSNASIAERLAISEKTVRNHASNIFDKLGVWSRAQAIVFARDHAFRG